MNTLPSRDGVSQDERLLPALREGYFNVDELRFEDLMAMAAEYAKLLKFTDAANKTAGNWQPFFDADEVSILASILAGNFNWYDKEVTQLVKESGAKLKKGSDSADKFPTFKLAVKVDFWLASLVRLPSVAAVRAHEKIVNIIEKILLPELLRSISWMSKNNVDSTQAMKSLSAVWQQQEAPPGALIIADEAQFLKSNCNSFYNAVLLLQRNMADDLISSLARSNHDPAMGVFITFLKLFKSVQNKINDYTHRHLKFYYEDVLKIQRREFVADSTHLIFTPDTPGREVLIKRDTEFKAGLDENNVELLYAANNDLLVNDVKVCALHTLYFERNEPSLPVKPLKYPFSPSGDKQKYSYSAAKLNRICEPGDKEPAEGETPAIQPLFGAPGRAKARGLFEDATLGFAVCSSVLLLKHGQRDITLTFKLVPKKLHYIKVNVKKRNYIKHKSRNNNYDCIVDQLSRNLPKATVNADTFFKVFRNMFNIALTGESGWLHVEEYLPLCNIVDKGASEKNSFKIIIRLPDSAPAIVPYAKHMHGESFDTDLPVIQFVVNPDAYFYPYGLLSRMVLKEVTIDVSVKGCTDVQVYNQSGQLSVNEQFNPFGGMPVMGDYLIVGNYEAARKKLSNFEVNVEWGGLPQEINGFEEYYRAYAMDFGNDTFQAALSVLRDRKWIPAETEQPKIAMFESGDSSLDSENKKIVKYSCFSFQGVCNYIRPLENIPEEKYSYDALTKDGFFKLALANPAYAFGHKNYPLILSKIMTDNANLQKFGLAKWLSKKLLPAPLPNPPYTPLINSLTINYSASTTISLERVTAAQTGQFKEGVFHLHPLGLEMLSPLASGEIRLVPHYEADGNLFIGLSASRLSGPLTLFFHLREDSLPEASTANFKFDWHYLVANQWRPLTPQQRISDTSNGFLSSGIVTLDIPADINTGNTVMPGDWFWLRVSTNNKYLHTLCSLYKVYAQALKVSWKRQSENSLAHLNANLPAGTIKEAKISIPGIAGICQLADSAGGLPPETTGRQTIRVSERLRHKNRAITPWDYERLILQEFPEVFKVKCLPCMTDDISVKDHPKPGHLLIVLIPYLQDTASVNFRPMVNTFILKKVKEFVRKLASVHVKITVRNPAYEQIQVRCRVKFKQGVAQGWAYNELNRAIVNYLSPWGDSGIKAKFDWNIRCHEIQAYLQDLEYVESLSGLSLLQIVEDDDRRHHQLWDTERSKNKSEAVPTHRWSIAIPTKQHLIEVTDMSGFVDGKQTGIAKLAIGSTFILSGVNHD